MRHLALVLLLLLMPCVSTPAATPSAPSPAPAKTGSILCAYWRELPGTRVEDLTTAPAYPNHPNEQVFLDRFQIPENQQGNFGTVIRGQIHPPADGSYTFFIAGNSQCELWLSPDSSPDAKRLIASVPDWSMPQDWTASPEQQSQPVKLKAGQTYYVEARHKNGGGDNHLAVAWKLPDGTLQAPIPGQFLSPATPVAVPPPTVVLPTLPTAPGRHRLHVQVDHLTQRYSVPVLLTLPPGYTATTTNLPALVFLADTNQESDADGFYVQGPDKLPPADPLLNGFICISPQPPAGRNYTQRTTITALAAVVTEIASRAAVDRQHLALTGQATGGTAVWRLAAQMPGFYTTLAPVNGWDIRDADLTALLRPPARPGPTRAPAIRIYTDIAEGFATGCANRMNDALATLNPKPQVIYLGEKELGKGSAPDYLYTQATFYSEILNPTPAISPSPHPPLSPSRGFAWIVSALALLCAAALALYLRRRQ